MSDLILYLSLAVIGYLIGSKLPCADSLQKWTNKLQTIAMIVIIFSMSMRMGANEYIVKPFIPEIVVRRVENVLDSSSSFRRIMQVGNIE